MLPHPVCFEHSFTLQLTANKSLIFNPNLQFPTRLQHVFGFSYATRCGRSLPVHTASRFPSVSISAHHLPLSLYPHLRMKSVSECFPPLSDPRWGGERSRLCPPPHHHLIIIHLGGRISTAWDIRPITQSRQATSPGPPTLPSLSRRAPIYWKGQCA